MTRTGILKIALAVGLVFLFCMSYMQQRTAVIPFISSAAADSDDASDDSEIKNLPRAAISVSVDIVSMQVLVTNESGNTITGLGRENFTIYEDGVKQEITHFSPVEANITVAMLIEFSKRNEIFHDEVYDAMYGFARTSLDMRGRLSQSDNSEFLMAENRLKSFAEYTGGGVYFPRYSTELPAIL